MDFTADDERSVLAALDRVLAAPDDRRLPEGVLGAADLLVAADSAVLTAVGTGTTYWSTSQALLRPALIDAFERTADSFPLVGLTRRGDGSTLRRSDVLADGTFHGLPVYGEVLRQIGAEHVLATSFRLPDGRTACLALNRAGRDFSERDVARVRALSARLSSLARFSAAWRDARPPPHTDRPLTPSEQRVLACVAGGLTDRAAARRLGLAEATVRKHLEHSYRKLGVTNRVAATVAWLTADRGVTGRADVGSVMYVGGANRPPRYTPRAVRTATVIQASARPR